MPCPNNCSFDGSSQSTIVCCLCEKLFHHKCCGLTARVIDLVQDSSKGLFWYCSGCRKTGTDLVNSYQVAMKAFKDLSLELSVLQGKFSKFSTEFNDSKILSEAQSRIKSGTSLRQNKKKHVDTVEKVVCPLVPSPHPPISIDSCGDAMPQLSAVPVPDEPPSKKPHTFAMVTRSRTTSSPVSPLSVPPPPVISSPVVVVANTSGLPTLKVVKPLKSVFIARLDADTSENDVLQYMLAKSSELSTDTVSVKKFKFAYKRNSSSFRIFVPVGLFDVVNNVNFWTEGIVVHEFKNKPKPKAAAPSKKTLLSKN